MGRTRCVSISSSFAAGLMLVLLSSLVMLGCGESGITGSDDASTSDQQVVAQEASIDRGVPLPDARPPVDCEPLSCDGLCGPVFDRCTGNTLECGGCTKTAQGEGCDPEKETCICDPGINKCTQLLLECDDFTPPYECGRIRNSCGKSRQCGFCPSDQECDPLTNTCVACTVDCPEGKCSQETCLKYGIECNVQTFEVEGVEQSGLVWLGCGDQRRDVVDCGNPCPDKGEVCNPFFNICEPDCEGPQGEDAVKAFCEAARAECGFISDGCGGRVDCGGDADCGCGKDGRPNKCAFPARPIECATLGWECGVITEPICANTPLDCGECDTENGEVCRDNNTCGPPCDVTTCTDYREQGQCGLQLDDGCGRVLAERCTCPTGQMCDTQEAGKVGTCVDQPTCETLGLGGPGQRCSPAKVFEREGLENIACPCGEGDCLGADGNPITGEAIGCCTMCTGEDGPCAPENACLGEVEQCCTGDLFCNEQSNTCESRKDCNDYTTRLLNQQCSTVANVNFAVGDGTNLTCDCRDEPADRFGKLACLGGGNTLDGPVGTCQCPDPRTCFDGLVFKCNRNNQWDGCGSRLTCNCEEQFGPNHVCFNDECCELPTCERTYLAGEACTISGCGRSVNCDCEPGYTCHSGVCCERPTCPAGVVFSLGETCVVQRCGETARCGCESGTHCSSRNNKCCTDLPACGARKTDGERRTFRNECGESKSCPCASGTRGSGDFCCRNLCASGIAVGNACGFVDENACGQKKTCNNCVSGATCYNGTCCDRRCTLSNVPVGGTCVQSKCGISNVCGNVCQVGICYQGKCCDDRCVPRTNVAVGQPCKRQQTKCGTTRTCTDTCVAGATCYQDECCERPTLPSAPANPGEVCKKTACGETVTRECAMPAGAEDPGAYTCGGDPALGADKCGCVDPAPCTDQSGNDLCGGTNRDRCGNLVECTC
jgi:hypothetical protein